MEDLMSFDVFINGEWRSASDGKYFNSTNPYTNKPWATTEYQQISLLSLLSLLDAEFTMEEIGAALAQSAQRTVTRASIVVR